MSFVEQEQALLDLLFKPQLRADFCQNSVKALAEYELDEAELNDFLAIRPDALELDATIRIDLILSQMSRQYPVTFGLLLSFANGLQCLQSLVDSALMRSKPLERNVYFGSRLREKITTLTYQSKQEYAFVNAILEAELAMVFTSSHLKEAVINEQVPANIPSALPANWLDLPIKLAAFVSAGVIPLPYLQLKQVFCPCEGLELWRQLNVSPITAVQRIQAFKQPDVRLLLARASVSHASRCESTIDFSTVELSEGFAPLFQYVDGEHSVAVIIDQLKQAGAQEEMLESIRSRFMQLLEQGMLAIT
jgi:hypothetical protein